MKNFILMLCWFSDSSLMVFWVILFRYIGFRVCRWLLEWVKFINDWMMCDMCLVWLRICLLILVSLLLFLCFLCRFCVR